jgi:hypothetical protein
MHRRTATAVVALTATAGLVAGCGGGSSGGKSNTSNVSGASASAELSSAISALGNGSTLTATLKLGATGSQLLSFVHQQDKNATMTAQQASAITAAAISFEVAAPSGKTLNQISGVTNAGAANIAVVDNGKAWFTIRVVKQTLYLQADLKDLLHAFGKDQTYRQMAGAGGQLPAFVAAAVQGKWISLSLPALKHAIPGAASASTPNPAQSKQFLDELRSLLTTDVTVTKSSSGGTDTLTLTSNLRTLAGDFKTTFATIPGVGAALSSTNVSTVPNKNVSIKATVSGGALTGLSLDVGQFAKSGQGSLPIELTFVQSGPSISAPSGALAVDLSQIAPLLGSLSGGGL